jgi:hypothetical protein
MIGSFELHHDNMSAHTALSVHEFLAKMHSCASAGSLFSILLTLWFYLFPELKLRVKGNHFQTLDSVQKAVTDAIPAMKCGKFAGPSVLH